MRLAVTVMTYPDRPPQLTGRDAAKVRQILRELQPGHEAAHAVVATVLGQEIEAVTIDQAATAEALGAEPGAAGVPSGACVYGGVPAPDVAAACAIAGPIWSSLRGLPVGLCLQMYGADAAEFASNAKTQAEREAAERKAREILAMHAAAVERVAAALVLRRRLSGLDVKRTLMS